MKQEITIKVTLAELLTLIRSYPKEVSPSEARRLLELQCFYNKLVEKHNKSLSMFESV